MSNISIKRVGVSNSLSGKVKSPISTSTSEKSFNAIQIVEPFSTLDPACSITRLASNPLPKVRATYAQFLEVKPNQTTNESIEENMNFYRNMVRDEMDDKRRADCLDVLLAKGVSNLSFNETILANELARYFILQFRQKGFDIETLQGPGFDKVFFDKRRDKFLLNPVHYAIESGINLPLVEKLKERPRLLLPSKEEPLDFFKLPKYELDIEPAFMFKAKQILSEMKVGENDPEYKNKLLIQYKHLVKQKELLYFDNEQLDRIKIPLDFMDTNLKQIYEEHAFYFKLVGTYDLLGWRLHKLFGEYRQGNLLADSKWNISLGVPKEELSLSDANFLREIGERELNRVSSSDLIRGLMIAEKFRKQNPQIFSDESSFRYFAYNLKEGEPNPYKPAAIKLYCKTKPGVNLYQTSSDMISTSALKRRLNKPYEVLSEEERKIFDLHYNRYKFVDLESDIRKALVSKLDGYFKLVDNKANRTVNDCNGLLDCLADWSKTQFGSKNTTENITNHIETVRKAKRDLDDLAFPYTLTEGGKKIETVEDFVKEYNLRLNNLIDKLKELEELLRSFGESQAMWADVIADVVAGLTACVLAPLTCGASLLVIPVGVGIGAGTKFMLKGLNEVGSNRIYAPEMAYRDLFTGGIAGGIGALGGVIESVSAKVIAAKTGWEFATPIFSRTTAQYAAWRIPASVTVGGSTSYTIAASTALYDGYSFNEANNRGMQAGLIGMGLNPVFQGGFYALKKLFSKGITPLDPNFDAKFKQAVTDWEKQNINVLKIEDPGCSDTSMSLSPVRFRVSNFNMSEEAIVPESVQLQRVSRLRSDFKGFSSDDPEVLTKEINDLFASWMKEDGIDPRLICRISINHEIDAEGMYSRNIDKIMFHKNNMETIGHEYNHFLRATYVLFLRVHAPESFKKALIENMVSSIGTKKTMYDIFSFSVINRSEFNNPNFPQSLIPKLRKMIEEALMNTKFDENGMLVANKSVNRQIFESHINKNTLTPEEIIFFGSEKEANIKLYHYLEDEVLRFESFSRKVVRAPRGKSVFDPSNKDLLDIVLAKPITEHALRKGQKGIRYWLEMKDSPGTDGVTGPELNQYYFQFEEIESRISGYMKKARELLNKYENLDVIYKDCQKNKISFSSSLEEFVKRFLFKEGGDSFVNCVGKICFNRYLLHAKRLCFKYEINKDSNLIPKIQDAVKNAKKYEIFFKLSNGEYIEEGAVLNELDTFLKIVESSAKSVTSVALNPPIQDGNKSIIPHDAVPFLAGKGAQDKSYPVELLEEVTTRVFISNPNPLNKIRELYEKLDNLDLMYLESSNQGFVGRFVRRLLSPEKILQEKNNIQEELKFLWEEVRKLKVEEIIEWVKDNYVISKDKLYPLLDLDNELYQSAQRELQANGPTEKYKGLMCRFCELRPALYKAYKKHGLIVKVEKIIGEKFNLKVNEH